MSVQPIPKGYHTITPYLAVARAGELIAFLQKAFGAEVVAKGALEDGTVLNAELRIGDSMVMLADARKTAPAPTMLYLYVKDCDEWYERAVKAGGKSVMPPTDHFYGDRSGGIEDPSGNQWWIATRKENVSEEEVIRRAKAAGRA